MASDLARGSRHVNRAYLDDPEMLEAYELYRMCVNKEVSRLEIGDKIHMRQYPTGFNLLPYPGSLMDQPHRLMEFFSCFINGEREAFYRTT